MLKTFFCWAGGPLLRRDSLVCDLVVGFYASALNDDPDPKTFSYSDTFRENRRTSSPLDPATCDSAADLRDLITEDRWESRGAQYFVCGAFDESADPPRFTHVLVGSQFRPSRKLTAPQATDTTCIVSILWYLISDRFCGFQGFADAGRQRATFESLRRVLKEPEDLRDPNAAHAILQRMRSELRTRDPKALHLLVFECDRPSAEELDENECHMALARLRLFKDYAATAETAIVLNRPYITPLFGESGEREASMRYLLVMSGDEGRARFAQWSADQVSGVLRPVFCSGYKQLDWSVWAGDDRRGSPTDERYQELAACERLSQHIAESAPVYSFQAPPGEGPYHPEDLLVKLQEVCDYEQATTAKRLSG